MTQGESGLLLGFPPLICKHGAGGRIRPTIQEAAEGPSLPRVPHVSWLRRWEGVSLGGLWCCLASVASIYVTKKHCPRTLSLGIPSLANAAQTGLVRTELSLRRCSEQGRNVTPPLCTTQVLPEHREAASFCPALRPRGGTAPKGCRPVSSAPRPPKCPQQRACESISVSPRQQRALGHALDVTLLMPLRPNERNRPEYHQLRPSEAMWKGGGSAGTVRAPTAAAHTRPGQRPA